MATDPYAAPKATVVDSATAVDVDYIPGGQALAPGAGFTWIAEGWQLFMKQPLMWIGFFVVFMLIFMVSAMIPVAGSIATVVFSPVMTAGLMIACRRLEEGDDLKLDYMFEGFRGKFGPLVIVGALYLAGTFIVMIAVALVFGLGIGLGAFAGMFKGGMQGSEAGLFVVLGIVLFVLLVFALFVPLFMAVWFAPPLIVFHDREPVAAMKESFAGCLRNILPFLLYGVIGLVLGFVASLPLFLGWLAVGPALMGSYYASYRGIFTRGRAAS